MAKRKINKIIAMISIIPIAFTSIGASYAAHNWHKAKLCRIVDDRIELRTKYIEILIREMAPDSVECRADVEYGRWQSQHLGQ